MTRKSFEAVIKKLVSYTKKIGAKIVFIGGIAISILTQPRTTYDIDFFISIDTKKIKFFLKQLTKIGFRPVKGIKIFSYFKFMTLYSSKHKLYLDIFFPTTEFQHAIVNRAKKVKIGNQSIYIASAEDMIILKLLSLRERDVDDIKELLTQKLDFGYLKQTAQKLGVLDLLQEYL